jgi:hypothetical protein
MVKPAYGGEHILNSVRLDVECRVHRHMLYIGVHCSCLAVEFFIVHKTGSFIYD